MNKTYIDSGLNLIVQILQKFQVVTKEKYIKIYKLFLNLIVIFSF